MDSVDWNLLQPHIFHHLTLPGEFPGHVMLQIDHSETTTQSQFSFEKDSPSNDLESLSFSNKVFYV